MEGHTGDSSPVIRGDMLKATETKYLLRALLLLLLADVRLEPKSDPAARSPRPSGSSMMFRRNLRLRAATREPIMRRLAEAWLEGQRKACAQADNG